MRLIDADEALRLFGKEYEETKELIHNGETQLDSLAEGFAEAHHIIKHVLPSVDAVVVTRCKDCARYRMGVCMKVYTDGDMFSARWQKRKPDDFCSYGEPKEEPHADDHD